MAINSPTGFRNTTLTNNSSSAGITPDYKNYIYTQAVPVIPNVPPVNNVSISNDDMDNGSSAASTQMSINQARSNMAADRVPDQIKGQQMYGPKLDPRMALPGAMFMGMNDPAVPTSGYGTPGTYSSLTGNQFDKDSRGIDPITGYAMPEYGTSKAFANQMVDDPFGNVFGDPKNAFDYAKTGPESLKSQTVQFSEAKGKDTDKAATKDLLDRGLSVSSAQPGSATHDASIGLGYSDTGAATAGSQFSSTGTFTTDSLTGGPDASNTESTGSTGVSVSNNSYADDAQSSGSGGKG